MIAVPLPSGDALTLDEMPRRLREAIKQLALVLENVYGVSEERSTNAAFVGGCIAARTALVWPAIVAEVHGVRV